MWRAKASPLEIARSRISAKRAKVCFDLLAEMEMEMIRKLERNLDFSAGTPP